jgi:hypothetical protein
VAFLNLLIRVFAENSMRGETEYAQGALLFQLVSRLAQSASGIDHVIYNDGITSLDTPDEGHRSDLSGSRPLLYNHGQICFYVRLS